MSPADDERRPLLQPAVSAEGDASTAGKVELSRRFWFAIPVIFGSCLAAVLPTTTTLAIIRLIVCRGWYETNRPGSLPPGTYPSESMCMMPEVAARYAYVVTVMGIIDAIGALVAFGAINFFVKKYGRKPVFIVLTCISAFAFSLWLAALYSPGSFAVVFLSFGILVGALANMQGILLVSRMFIVDTTAPEQRTSALSFMGAAAVLGLTPSFALGGYITSRTNEVTPVYWITLGLQFLVLLYEIFILPESYVTAERKEAQEEMEHDVEEELHHDVRPGPRRTSVERVLKPLLSILQPLVILVRQDPETGRRDFRLVLAATASFLWSLGSAYLALALLLRLTNEFHLPPDKSGVAMSLFLGSRALFLTCIFPFIIKYGRRAYGKFTQTGDGPQAAQDLSGRFDSYIIIFSWILDAVFFTYVGLATTAMQIFVAITVLSLSSGSHPALNSVLVASVHHHQSDEILSANAMLESIGQVLSPIVLGSILAATVNTFPAAMFLVSSGLSLLATSALIVFKVLDR